MTRDEARHDLSNATTVERAVLVRYRVMALTTGVLLIVLVFVGVPLQLAGRPGVVNVVGTVHGFLYMVYLYTAFSLTRRLRVPTWQTLLVLLAGTIPFCAFVAERKMTRRFDRMVRAPAPDPEPSLWSSLRERAAGVRRRWLSRRAMLLHVEFALVASGCLLAGWWQATRALAGNELSWVYSVEWPAFALLTVAGWWHLIHEDPRAYRARRAVPRASDVSARRPSGADAAVDSSTARVATAMLVGVAVEAALGIFSALSLPFDRPSLSIPTHGKYVYVAHGVLGLLLALAGAGLVLGVRASGRMSKAVAWTGFVGIGLAGAGGLLTEARSLARFCGMALMLVGALSAALGYSIPLLVARGGRAAPEETVLPEATTPGLS